MEHAWLHGHDPDAYRRLSITKEGAMAGKPKKRICNCSECGAEIVTMWQGGERISEPPHRINDRPVCVRCINNDRDEGGVPINKRTDRHRAGRVLTDVSDWDSLFNAAKTGVDLS
jgi:hypothetical protein